METLETAQVASLLKYFNAAAITVVVLAAACGAVAAFYGKSGFNILKGRALPTAICIAALAAFILEGTAFNFQRYLKIFAGPEIETLDPDEENPNYIPLTGGAPPAEIVVENSGRPDAAGGVIFRGLDIKVTSIYSELQFGESESVEMLVTWTDEQSTHSFKKRLLKNWPQDNYAPLQPCGKVSELKVMFAIDMMAGNVVLEKVALNRPIPFYFSGLRLIVATLAIFAGICLFKKDARERAAYYLFGYKFDPANKRQNLAYAAAAALLVLFSYISINTSYKKSYYEYPTHRQYNQYLVDALANGRTWLDYGTPENLLKAERPYDNDYRLANGYRFDSDVMWDWAWYKGKFYCYFGVVPAVVLYLPYYKVTGKYLSNNAGIFLFTAASIALMALLWRRLAQKYLKNPGFAFVLLGLLALFFASGMYNALRYVRFYNIVKSAGVMFALGGALLLLKSVDKGKANHALAAAGCLCLALIAGCRPNMAVAALLAPVILWKHRSWKLLAAAAAPFVAVAIPLMWYNYARFESAFDFGGKYNLTGYPMNQDSLLNPIGAAIKVFYAAIAYIFGPNGYSLYFPFVNGFQGRGDVAQGVYQNIGIGSGIVNFPIVFCLLWLFCNIKKVKEDGVERLLAAFTAVAALIILANAYVVGFGGAYVMDFAVFLIIPALICAHYWQSGVDGALESRNRQTAVFALLAASVFTGLFLTVTAGMSAPGIGVAIPYDDVLYRYLEYSLALFRST